MSAAAWITPLKAINMIQTMKMLLIRENILEYLLKDWSCLDFDWASIDAFVFIVFGVEWFNNFEIMIVTKILS